MVVFFGKKPRPKIRINPSTTKAKSTLLRLLHMAFFINFAFSKRCNNALISITKPASICKNSQSCLVSDITVCIPAPFTKLNSSIMPVPAKKQKSTYKTTSLIFLIIFAFIFALNVFRTSFVSPKNIEHRLIAQSLTKQPQSCLLQQKAPPKRQPAGKRQCQQARF